MLYLRDSRSPSGDISIASRDALYISVQSVEYPYSARHTDVSQDDACVMSGASTEYMVA